MKVLCSACEAAEARVLCCADDAALCARCDRDVHAANRLAGKHHRLPLLSSSSSSAAAAASSSPPKCDICQECHAYFFCVEDRALLCRSCDVAVHTANAFVSAHRRFLLTGVQVGLDATAAAAAAEYDDRPHPLSPTRNTASSAPPLQQQPPRPPPCTRKRSPSPLYSDDDVIDWATGGQDVNITGNLPDWSVVNEQFTTPAPPARQAVEPVVTKTPPKRSSRGPVTAGTAGVFGNLAGLAGGSLDWPLNEFFGFAELNAGFGFAENGTSKADSGKLGSMDGSPNGGRSSSSSSSAAATAAGHDFFGQVPDVHWDVPELPSPPTASGLHWQRDQRYGGAAATDAGAVFVPDISPENPFRCFAAGAGDHAMKRRRRC